MSRENGLTARKSTARKSTRERIVDQALELFNEKGIEAVGMRDLARELSLSPGNLTYHFAKKEDVIVAIAERLSALNSQTHVATLEPQSIRQFLGIFRTIFHNHYQFRCLLLSIVHLNEQYPSMAARYRGVQEGRAASFQDKIRHLRSVGYLRHDVTETEIQRMAGFCSMIGRFWLSEYWIDDRTKPIDDAMEYYLDLLSDIFLPYVTVEGYRDLAKVAEE